MKTFFCFLVLATQLCFGETKECTYLLKFSFDDREWVQGYEASNEEGSIIEYILKGESIDDWSELVTVQRFTNVGATINEFYSTFIEELKKAGKPADVHITIIGREKDNIFFEWWIDEEESNAQREWFRLFKIPDSVVILRYTTKKLDNIKQARDVWEKILKRAYITEDCN